MVAAYGSEAQAPRPQYVQVSPARGGPVPGALTSAGSVEGLSGWVQAGRGPGPGGRRVQTPWWPPGGAAPPQPSPRPCPQARPGRGALRAASTGQVHAHLGAAKPPPLPVRGEGRSQGSETWGF